MSTSNPYANIVENSGAAQNATIGTDLLQIVDILSGGNNFIIPFDGTRGLYVSNQSGDDILVELLANGAAGTIQTVVRAWSDCAVTSPDPLMEAAIIDLCGPSSTIPQGFQPHGSFSCQSGYVVVIATSDPYQFHRGDTPDRRGGSCYKCVVSSVPPSVTHPVLDPQTDPNLPRNVSTIDIMNLDAVNSIGLFWITNYHPGGGSPIQTGGQLPGSNLIQIPPHGSMSLDVDLEGREPPLLAAMSLGTTNATIQVIVRGD